MSSYEDRMSEKYGFFSDNKKTVEEQQNLEEDKSSENFEQDKSENNENNLIVPLEAWQTVLNQLGNLHEANQLMAEARERAAKSEAEAEFE